MRTVPLGRGIFSSASRRFIPHAPVFLAAHIRVKFFGERSDALAVLRCCLCFRAAARIFLLKLVSRYRLCFYTAVYFSAAARFRSDTSF